MARLTARPKPCASEPVDVLANLRTVASVNVTARDGDGGVSTRAVTDAVNALPQVVAARQRAADDRDRSARVRRAVSGVVSRFYRASVEHAERPLV